MTRTVYSFAFAYTKTHGHALAPRTLCSCGCGLTVSALDRVCAYSPKDGSGLRVYARRECLFNHVGDLSR